MCFTMIRGDGQRVMRGSGNAGENEDYFGCIDRSTGTKVHASSMLFYVALFSERWVPEWK